MKWKFRENLGDLYREIIVTSTIVFMAMACMLSRFGHSILESGMLSQIKENVIHGLLSCLSFYLYVWSTLNLFYFQQVFCLVSCTVSMSIKKNSWKVNMEFSIYLNKQTVHETFYIFKWVFIRFVDIHLDEKPLIRRMYITVAPAYNLK